MTDAGVHAPSRPAPNGSPDWRDHVECHDAAPRAVLPGGPAVPDIIGYLAAVRSRASTSKLRTGTRSWCGFGPGRGGPERDGKESGLAGGLNDGTDAGKTTPRGNRPRRPARARMAGDTAHPAGDPVVAGPGRGRLRRLAPGRQAGAPRLPATACAPDRPVRQSMAGSLPVQRLTGDALWARVASQARCADSGLDPDQWYPVSIEPARARHEAAAAIAICTSCPVRAIAWSCRCGTGMSASTVSGAACSPPTARTCAVARRSP